MVDITSLEEVAICPRCNVSVSVVIPCYRSEATITPLVRELHAVLVESVDDYEIVLVVDGSPDNTDELAVELARDRRVRALLLSKNYGQHNALLAGISRSRYEVIVTMDDDLQHLPSQVPVLLTGLTADTDLVYGVPTSEEHEVMRSAASRLVKRSLAVAGVPNAADVTAFRAFRRELRTAFQHVADPFSNIDVLLSWATARVRRVPVEMRRRVSGRSNYGFSGLTHHAFNMITGYSIAPLRIVTYLGLACSAIGVALFFLVLWSYATGTTTVAGFSTIASMLAVFSGAQMLSLGILGEYLGRLHFRSMQQPPYVIREETGTLADGT